MTSHSEEGSKVVQSLERASNPNQIYVKSLSPARRQAAIQALGGDPRTGHDAKVVSVTLPNGIVTQRSEYGCQAEAERALYGDLTRWTQSRAAVSGIRGVVDGRMFADERYKAAVTVWSQCMAKAGHAYASPAKARGAFADKPATESSRIQELAVAAAEVTCARQVYADQTYPAECYTVGQEITAEGITSDTWVELQLAAAGTATSAPSISRATRPAT